MNILEITAEDLARYARIPMRFTVRRVLTPELIEGGLGGIRLVERAVTPYVKDYDADGQTPTRWAEAFDVSRWGFFVAHEAGRDLGAAAVAFDTLGVDMLEGRSDLGVLWDLRVHPDAARSGVGSALFAHAVGWLRELGATRLKVETQNVNLPACRFYRAQGCSLAAIRRFAYAELPGELQLLWYKDLTIDP